MGRMLFHVPRMYCETEFKRIARELPGDFSQRAAEFWSYVEEKLRPFAGKINRVYVDEVCKIDDQFMSQLRSKDNDMYLALSNLVENGTVFEATENPLLLAEYKSWAAMLDRNLSNSAILTLVQETMRDRDMFVSKKICETLRENELGALFMEPSRGINLEEDIKIVRVCRFNPLDYLRSWQVSLDLRPRSS